MQVMFAPVNYSHSQRAKKQKLTELIRIADLPVIKLEELKFYVFFFSFFFIALTNNKVIKIFIQTFWLKQTGVINIENCSICILVVSTNFINNLSQI